MGSWCDIGGVLYFVIIGAISLIASVTSKLVPTIAALYIAVALVVILTNLGKVGPVFSSIINGAFTASGVTGGFVGALIQGLTPALIQGNGSGLIGANLTSASFRETADWFKYPLAIAVVMFAISTMISWSYYRLKAWTYLFGEDPSVSIGFGAVSDFSDAAVFAISQ